MVAAAAVARDGLNGLELDSVGLQLGLGRLRILVERRRDVRDDNGGRSRLGQDAGLEDAATFVARTVIIEALADDLAALDDDGSMAVVKRRQTGLLDTEIEIRIGLHCRVQFSGDLF